MKSLLPLALVAVVLVALVLVAPAAGDTESARPGDQAANIRFNLTMIDTDATGNAVKQTVEALLVSDRETRTHAGWRVPFPVASVHATDGRDMPVTSWQYQDVGLALSLQGRALPHGRVRASGRVEITGVDRQDASLNADAPSPQIGTFSHQFEATLLDGAPTALVSIPKPSGGSMVLTLTASMQP